MDQEINELTVWDNGAPVINLNPNQEFDIWKDNSPVTDIDESKAQPTPPSAGRRRSFIF